MTARGSVRRPKGDTKSIRTRKRILDAAANVLSRKGYAGMRLSDVAERAEVQAPAIYYYFDSRDALIEEVMWSGIEQMRLHIAQVLADLPVDTKPIDRLAVAIEQHLRHAHELSNYATASIRNAGQVPTAIRDRQIIEERAYGEIWADIVREARDAGEIRADLDLYMVQMLIFGALNWTGEWWDPRRGDIDDLVKNATAFILNGLT